MQIHDEHYLRIQRLYNKADTLVGINHRMAAEKFQVFGKDAMERLGEINLQKMLIFRKAMFFKFMSKALTHYIDFEKKTVHADNAQITAFFRSTVGKQWFCNLKYCIGYLTKIQNKQAAIAARELFSSDIESEHRQKLESMTQVKAFVVYIHYLAKDVKGTNVIKVDFKRDMYSTH